MCTEGDASKFWRVKVAGSIQKVRYGRIGTEGHELVKTFEGPVAAGKATQKLIAEKLGKGYREVSENEATAAHEAERSDAGTAHVKPKSRRSGKALVVGLQQLTLSFDEARDETEMQMQMQPIPQVSLSTPKPPPALALEF
nr:WGR domain-containing protein [Armatimonas rosea]